MKVNLVDTSAGTLIPVPNGWKVTENTKSRLRIQGPVPAIPRWRNELTEVMFQFDAAGKLKNKAYKKRSGEFAYGTPGTYKWEPRTERGGFKTGNMLYWLINL